MLTFLHAVYHTVHIAMFNILYSYLQIDVLECVYLAAMTFVAIERVFVVGC